MSDRIKSTDAMCKLILIIIIAFLGISYGNAKTKMQSPPYESKVNGKGPNYQFL